MRSLLLLFFFLFSTALHAQQRFYYSNNRRITLTEDSTSLFAVFTPGKQLTKASVIRSLAVRGIKADSVGERGIIKLATAGRERKAFLKSLRTDSNLLYVWPALTANASAFLPTGKIVLQLKSPYTLDQLINNLGITDQVSPLSHGETFYETLFVKNDDSLLNIANRIYESGMVEFSHPDALALPKTTDKVAPPPAAAFENRSGSFRYTPTDTYFLDQWYLYNHCCVLGNDLNITGVWDYSKGSNTIKICVIDQGIEAHEDLTAANMLPGYTPKNASSHGAPIPGNTHGESVAGIILATQNSIGMAGIVPNCKYFSVNIFYGGETASDIANAFTWAWQTGGADIINCSWELDQPYDVVKAAIQNTYHSGRGGKGTAVVFAAGNAGGAISFPASYDSVITIGAIDPYGNHQYYSNKGSKLDAVCLSGVAEMYGITRMGAGDLASNYTQHLGGTSFAAPQATAVGALVLSINPNVNADYVKSMIISYANHPASPGLRNDSLGFGRVDACATFKNICNNAGTISGPVTQSTTTATYSIGNLPDAVANTAVWSAFWGASHVSFSSHTGKTITLTKLSVGDVYLRVKLGPFCGDSIIFFHDVQMINSALKVAPNPASSTISVALVEPAAQADEPIINTLQKKEAPTEITEVHIIDKMGNTVLTRKFTGGQKKVNFDVSTLKDDNYIIKVFDGHSWSSDHIIVSHN